MQAFADLIVTNARVLTMDSENPPRRPLPSKTV